MTRLGRLHCRLGRCWSRSLTSADCQRTNGAWQPSSRCAGGLQVSKGTTWQVLVGVPFKAWHCAETAGQCRSLNKNFSCAHPGTVAGQTAAAGVPPQQYRRHHYMSGLGHLQTFPQVQPWVHHAHHGEPFNLIRWGFADTLNLVVGVFSVLQLG